MPAYEFKCTNKECSMDKFIVYQRMSEEHVACCDVCGLDAQRVYSDIAIDFKGPGFYVNDYKGK